jgi:hypothetical protein
MSSELSRILGNFQAKSLHVTTNGGISRTGSIVSIRTLSLSREWSRLRLAEIHG